MYGTMFIATKDWDTTEKAMDEKLGYYTFDAVCDWNCIGTYEEAKEKFEKRFLGTFDEAIVDVTDDDGNPRFKVEDGMAYSTFSPEARFDFSALSVDPYRYGVKERSYGAVTKCKGDRWDVIGEKMPHIGIEYDEEKKDWVEAICYSKNNIPMLFYDFEEDKMYGNIPTCEEDERKWEEKFPEIAKKFATEEYTIFAAKFHF